MRRVPGVPGGLARGMGLVACWIPRDVSASGKLYISRESESALGHSDKGAIKDEQFGFGCVFFLCQILPIGRFGYS